PIARRASRRARGSSARARDRRRLQAGHGAAEPLLPGDLAGAIRRVHLVRRDRSRARTACRRGGSRGATAPAGTMTPSELMASFADRTGLTGAKPQRRYLWTDAFAVCNLLGLGRIDDALALIGRVHHVLGAIGPTISDVVGSAACPRPMARRIQPSAGYASASRC